jgi:Uma2 family endonuclease
MATATHIPLEVYLRSSYEPDAEYVDGDIEERNAGEYDHNAVQKAVLIWFYLHEKEWHIRGIQEQRTRVAPSRVRLPDVSVFSRDLPIEQVFTRPQLIAVEVLSPEDRHSKIDEKIQDYIKFGVQNVWVIDPTTRIGWDCSTGNWVRTDQFTAKQTTIYLSLSELFASIDFSNA